MHCYDVFMKIKTSASLRVRYAMVTQGCESGWSTRIQIRSSIKIRIRPSKRPNPDPTFLLSTWYLYLIVTLVNNYSDTNWIRVRLFFLYTDLKLPKYPDSDPHPWFKGTLLSLLMKNYNWSIWEDLKRRGCLYVYDSTLASNLKSLDVVSGPRGEII